MKKNIVFLPCRKGSQRIPQKNTRQFAGIEGGLLQIKLTQLLATKEIDEIVLSSDDEEVLEIGRKFHDNRIVISRRPSELCTSETTTDALIAYVPTLIKDNDATIIWTHVTSPFLSASTYTRMIAQYYEGLGEYDSLMSVNPLRTFIWNEHGSVNYDRKEQKWPRTQTLDKWYEVNSGVFIADIDIYRKLNDRVGNKVQLFETDKLDSIDIDWPEDFEFAEMLYTNLKKD